MTRLRLRLEYEGSGFEGWQLQARGRTIQGTLEAAIREVTGTEARIYAAGRTDAGVHAMDQVCHFDSETSLSPEDLKRALNGVLPEDVGVTEARAAAPDFDSRRDVVRKRYRYRILNRTAPSPLRRGVTWHIRRSLEIPAMRRAAELLVGEHDFSAFRGAPGGPPPPESTVRKLERLSVDREGDEVRIEAEGRSFVRYMVRNLAGTLVEIGRGQMEPGSIPGILESRDRARAGQTAPARGLCLVRILYGDENS
jgi:tRNA pseudouridine38-40 synthase